MKSGKPDSTYNWGHQITLTFSRLVISAILLHSNLNAAPQQDGPYPAVPEAPTPPSTVCDLLEGFDNSNDLTATKGWVIRNNSQPLGGTNWLQGSSTVFASQAGAANSYIAANYQNASGLGTISDWLITPPVMLQNGGQLSFWTRTVDTPLFPDRLQVRMSLNGTSSDVGSTATSVGDFTILLLDINPTYTQTGYPNGWTNQIVTLGDIAAPVEGRLAFRYFVENSSGTHSDYVGIDSFQYCCTGCGLATPTPSPAPTASPSPSPVATPCSCGGVNISGTISSCTNPSRAPVPGVTVTLDPVNGTPPPIFRNMPNQPNEVSTSTNANGFYDFSHITVFSNNHLVVPSKARLLPGSAGITTVDVLATNKHFLGQTLLSGCRLTAADVNADSTINTVDVIAIQRFYLGLSTGTANVGKYQFNPSAATYFGINFTRTDQNYDALVFGDVASPFTQ